MDATPSLGPFGAAAAATLEHLNDEHDDTVRFLAAAYCDDVDVRRAELTRVDHAGLTARLVTADGDAVVRQLAFETRAESAEDAQLQFYALLTAARQRCDDAELTSLERELSGVRTIATFVTRVSAVGDVNPRLREITVEGGLGRFEPLGPDQFVYVLAPPHGRHALTIDESFTWERYETMPASERPVGAYYTVRRWHPDTRSLDLWVVLHGHDGDGERWARNARPGDPVALWGPRQAYEPPSATASILLIGDETALPAIAAIVEQLDAAQRATVIIGLAPDVTADDVPPLSSPAALDVRWVTLGHGPGNALLDAVVGLPGERLTADTYVWGGAESHDITAIRRHVRDVIGLPRRQVSLTGYWRRDPARA